MSTLSTLLALLDSRSFASLWYWLAFAGLWSLASRNVLGIPSELVLRARRDDTAQAALLQWLALVLPHWRVGPGMAAVLAGLAGFLAAVLAVLGFAHDMEAAQALLLLLAPLAAVMALRIRLARDLARLLATRPPQEAAPLAARRLLRHGWVAYGVALAAIAVTSLVAAAWIARHPFGI